MSRKKTMDMDLIVSGILRAGLGLSLCCLAVGVAWKLLKTGGIQFDYTLPRTNVLQFLVEEMRLAIRGLFRPRLFNNLGIVFLMLTPYVRVLASMVYFACVERNRKYTVFTGFVLAVLTYSLLIK